MDIITILERYNTHELCIAYLEKAKWGSTPKCHYCKSESNSPMQKEHRHKCHSCNRSFSVLLGTVFTSTKLPLTKWFVAIYLIVDAKKGISSLQLSRHLNVNKDTAWYMQKRIREAMEEDNYLTGIVETDETYIGGNLIKMKHQRKREKGYLRCGMEHKTPVLGMFERKGKVVLKVLKKAWGEEIKPILKHVISADSIVVTDGFGAYYGIGDYYKEHIKINHAKYVFNVDELNTSTIEGFWTIVKRALIGIYHQVSDKYLQHYLNEISYKYNCRGIKNKFDLLLNRILNGIIPLNG